MDIGQSPRQPLIGPDHLLAHKIETYKLQEGHFETMVWRGGNAAPIQELVNDNWEDALLAHAVAWQMYHEMEQKRRRHYK